MAVSAIAAMSLAVLDAHKRYLQPKMLSELAKASGQIAAGKIEEADARLDLVLVRGPIRITLDVDGLTVVDRLSAEAAFRDAISIWKSELGDEVQFDIVPAEMAQVRFRFNEGAIAGGRCAGHAVWSRQVWFTGGEYRADLSADVEMARKDSTGTVFSAQTLTQAVAHELGHILGMDDSGRRGDLMGPVRPDQPVGTLTVREREALEDLRSEGQELAQVCLLQKLHMSW